MKTTDEQLIKYKTALENVFFNGEYSGDAADLIRKQIIEVGKAIKPTSTDFQESETRF